MRHCSPECLLKHDTYCAGTFFVTNLMHLSAVVRTCTHRCLACWQSSLVHCAFVRHGPGDELQGKATPQERSSATGKCFIASTSMPRTAANRESYASPDFPKIHKLASAFAGGKTCRELVSWRHTSAGAPASRTGSQHKLAGCTACHRRYPGSGFP